MIDEGSEASRDERAKPETPENGAARSAACARSEGRRRGGWASRVLGEPLLQFLLIGAVLVALRPVLDVGDDRHRIVIDDGLVARLSEGYASQFGQAPSAAQLRSLIDLHVEDEMLYREGRALALAQDDVVIRRRIVQKMRFLVEDRSIMPAPTEDEVVAWYEAQADRYVVPESLAFNHVYFAIEGREEGDEKARRCAEQALVALRAEGVTRAPERGDRFPGSREFGSTSPEAIRRTFGDSALADALFEAPVGDWSGPYRSGFGWHVVFVSDRRPSRRAPLEAVRNQVEQDLVEARRAAENEVALARLRQKYTVLRSDEGSP